MPDNNTAAVNRSSALRTAGLMAAVLILAAGLRSAAAQLPDFRPLIREHGPAVVSINTVRGTAPQAGPQGGQLPPNMPEFLRRFFEQMPQMPGPGQGQQPPAHGIGSGFIISQDGYVVTNAHVVAGADEINVTTTDRREMTAELVGMDERTDIALLKVDASGLPALQFGDSRTLEVGEWVLAIGNPFGLEYTATQGIVSGLGRSLPRENYTPFIQTDVAVNPGNSGGPLFDLDGRVVGINSQIFSRTGGYMGLSFAIPAEIAIDVVEQLKSDGRVSRGWLGVTIQDLDQALAESFNLDGPRGALVADVVAGGPAEAAGLQRGDVILEYNGETLARSSELPPLVGATRPGKDAKLRVLRDGKRKTIAVTVAEFEDGDNALASTGMPGAEPQGGRLGLVVSDFTDEARKRFGDDRDGVVVNKVKSGSAADRAGIRPGDIIVSFNQQGVDSSRKLIELANSATTGSSVAVLVIRDNSPRFLAMQIPEEVG